MARVIPTTTFQQDTNLVASQTWNDGTKGMSDFLSNKPTFRGVGGIASVANNTWGSVPFTSHLIDTDGGHNTVVNNTRYVCQVAGWYWVKGTVCWNGTGTFPNCRTDSAIAVNATIVAGSSQFMYFGPNAVGAHAASSIVHLSVTDYVEVWGRQETGGTMSFDAGTSGTTCGMEVWWISS